MRQAEKIRATNETSVEVKINLDGTGKYDISTGLKFFDHMLEQFAVHSSCDLTLKVTSHDKDSHHIVEDVALTLGAAIKDALGEKKGIARYGEMHLPMDESLVLAVIDLSGRPFSRLDVPIKDERTSDFETVLLPHFFSSLAQSSLSTIHIMLLHGSDTHHIIEAVFKSFARAFRNAAGIDIRNADKIPSSKGIL